MLLMIWCALLALAAWLYLRQVYSRFDRSGVKHYRIIPFIGNMGRTIFKIDHFVDEADRMYFEFPEERLREKVCTAWLYICIIWHIGSRFVGKFEFIKPVVIIRDLELIKKITVKDFEYFLDHRDFIDAINDPLFGRNLFSLKGQEWKDMRSTLSPAFTSSKIRVMVPFMVEVGDQMINALKQKIQVSNGGYMDVDVKDLTTRYANDVIASCAFGLKVDSLMEVDNKFYTMGKIASNFSFKQILLFFGFSSFPKLMNILKVSLFSEATKSFFTSLVLDTMQDRENRDIVRPDMIHLLMEAKKGRLLHEDKADNMDTDAGFATVEESSVGKKAIDRVWSDVDLVAQAVLFFIGGFETVSASMSFLLHELALHHDVQEKLLQEIRQLDERNGGKFDYNAIQNMKYMDMVVSELLRLWSPGVALDRICTKNYNMGKPNDKSSEDFILRKGEGINIPVWSIHRNPEYFPDPLKFDPERFSDENKHKIQPFTYMPFGLGPRNCIASRFALCEVKAMTYQLLRVFQLSPCAKTQIPAKLCKETFNIRIEGGHWLRFAVRK